MLVQQLPSDSSLAGLFSPATAFSKAQQDSSSPQHSSMPQHSTEPVQQQLEAATNLAERRGQQVQELTAQVVQLQADSKAADGRAQAQLRQALSAKDEEVKELQRKHEADRGYLQAQAEQLRKEAMQAQAASRSTEDQLQRELKSLRSRLKLAQQVYNRSIPSLVGQGYQMNCNSHHCLMLAS